MYELVGFLQGVRLCVNHLVRSVFKYGFKCRSVAFYIRLSFLFATTKGRLNIFILKISSIQRLKTNNSKHERLGVTTKISTFSYVALFVEENWEKTTSPSPDGV